MAKAYYGTKISEHMTKTPEGYLICHSVPVARTGWQDYLGSEIGLTDAGLVKVYRSADEVFAPATIASFEGKTVTDGHPPQWLAPDNESSYSKGHGQNSRQGGSDEPDLLIADLFIKDAVLINKVENGLREVSCGYDCVYEPMEAGQYAQKQIRGNHIAIVPNGRAGDRVAIRDSQEELIKPKNKEIKKMALSLRTIFGLGLKEYAKDADPEKVAEAFEMAKKGEEEGKAKDEESPVEERLKKVEDAVCGIRDALQELVKSDKEVHKEVGDALDKAIKDAEAEGSKEDEKEDEKEKEAKDAEVIPVETLTGNEIPENPIPGADSKVRLNLIKSLKPHIAKIKDEADRKKMTDVLIGMINEGKTSSQSASYGDLLKVKKPDAILQAQDRARSRADDDVNYGRSLKDKYHRKAVSK